MFNRPIRSYTWGLIFLGLLGACADTSISSEPSGATAESAAVTVLPDVKQALIAVYVPDPSFITPKRDRTVANVLPQVLERVSGPTAKNLYVTGMEFGYSGYPKGPIVFVDSAETSTQTALDISSKNASLFREIEGYAKFGDGKGGPGYTGPGRNFPDVLLNWQNENVALKLSEFQTDKLRQSLQVYEEHKNECNASFTLKSVLDRIKVYADAEADEIKKYELVAITYALRSFASVRLLKDQITPGQACAADGEIAPLDVSHLVDPTKNPKLKTFLKESLEGNQLHGAALVITSGMTRIINGIGDSPGGFLVQPSPTRAPVGVPANDFFRAYYQDKASDGAAISLFANDFSTQLVKAFEESCLGSKVINPFDGAKQVTMTATTEADRKSASVSANVRVVFQYPQTITYDKDSKKILISYGYKRYTKDEINAL